jgi:agmatine deiminase
MEMANLISHFSQNEALMLGILPEVIPDQMGESNRFTILYDDIWIRDTEPTILSDGQGKRIAIDWKFNSWGGLFDSFELDNTVANQIALYHGMDIIKAPIVLEGGAILTDGKGTLFVTEESVLVDSRNPGLSKQDASEILSRYTNCSNIIWIPRGLANDEAGGHIDNLLTLAPNNTIVVSSCDDSEHPSYHRLQEFKNIIMSAKDITKKAYKVVNVPLPEETKISSSEATGFVVEGGTIERDQGVQLAPSYTNICISNTAVFVPSFDSASDKTAVDIFKNVFTNRSIVPIRSREFLLGGGALHCISKEIPI